MPVHSTRQPTKDAPSATPGSTQARSLARKEDRKGQDERKAQRGRASVVLSPADGDRGPPAMSTLGGYSRVINRASVDTPHLQHDVQRLRRGLTGRGHRGAAGRQPRLQLPQQLRQRAVVLARPGGPPVPRSNGVTVCSLCARAGNIVCLCTQHAWANPALLTPLARQVTDAAPVTCHTA